MADATRSSASSQISEEENEVVEGRLLDGFLLLAAGGSPNPEDAITANLSSLNLVDVAEEDLSFFLHLDRLDASDNQLSYEQILAQMSRLPRLASLSLACNSISSLQVPVGAARKLKILDLSFNELHGDVLIQLSHLPELVTLNLARNCISLVPPEAEEDLYGLVHLEELILDSNDLVQFIQWRALDALPKLRKLSLASNRVKRLKDDAPDTALGSEKLMYFPRLEELNLANNEITNMQSLPVLKAFRTLRKLNLADNPVTRGVQQGDKGMHMGSIHVTCERTKPWYLKGNGCHQAYSKKGKPKVRMPGKGAIRKVKPPPLSNEAAARSKHGGHSQIGILDAEANQLLIDMGAISESAAVAVPRQSNTMVPVGVRHANSSVLGDELSEAELRIIFRERGENIERKFDMAETKVSESEMRSVPFEISSAAGQKLLQLRPGLRPAQAASYRQEEEGAAPGTRPVSASAFMTSIQEDESDGGRPRRPLESVILDKEVTQSQSQGLLPPLYGRGAAANAGLGATAGSASFADLTFEVPGAAAYGGGGGGGKRKPADVGVKEAMRALRAAMQYDKFQDEKKKSGA